MDYPLMVFFGNTTVEATAMSLHMLGITVGLGKGKYKGVEERIVMAVAHDPSEYDLIMEAVSSGNEESVLRFYPGGEAELLFLDDNRVESLGTMSEVTEEEAKASDAYTNIGGTYFVAK